MTRRPNSNMPLPGGIGTSRFGMRKYGTQPILPSVSANSHRMREEMPSAKFPAKPSTCGYKVPSWAVSGAGSAGATAGWPSCEPPGVRCASMTLDVSASAPADLVATCCSTYKETPAAMRKSDRTGGCSFSVSGQGIVVDFCEFLGTESLSQRYFYVAKLNASLPELRHLIHDDACHLRKFAHARRDSSDMAWSIAYPQLHHVLDRLHAPGHEDEWCKQNVHHELPEYAQKLLGFNTEACEQCNAFLARLKFGLQHFQRHSIEFVITELVEARNEWIQMRALSQQTGVVRPRKRRGRPSAEANHGREVSVGDPAPQESKRCRSHTVPC